MQPNTDTLQRAIAEHAAAQKRVRQTQLDAQRLAYDSNASDEDIEAAWYLHDLAQRDVSHWDDVADRAQRAIANGAR